MGGGYVERPGNSFGQLQPDCLPEYVGHDRRAGHTLAGPGHGRPTDDPQEIQARLAGDRAYLDELAGKVSQAVGQGKSMEETVDFCRGIAYRQAAENTAAHQLNIESAYLEAGGDPDGRATAGWAQVG